MKDNLPAGGVHQVPAQLPGGDHRHQHSWPGEEGAGLWDFKSELRWGWGGGGTVVQVWIRILIWLFTLHIEEKVQHPSLKQ